jgi:hypothetical protein
VFAIQEEKRVSIEQQLILLGMRWGDMSHLQFKPYFVGDSKGETFSSQPPIKQLYNARQSGAHCYFKRCITQAGV